MLVQVVAQNNDFSIVLFPDTQGEVAYKHETWESMPKWTVDNKANMNIKAVIGLGDVTDTNTAPEYSEAVKGWNIIKNADIVYVPIRGNHDATSSLWNQYFGTSYFSGKTWFGGAYKNDTSTYYVKFNSGSYEYLVLALGYNPNDARLTWAQNIINSNDDLEIIVVTHSYLNATNLTIEGENIWNKLVEQNKNIFLVVCGHLWPPFRSYVVATGTNRNKINQLCVDYEGVGRGRGYIEILKFQPSKSRITSVTFSPSLNRTIGEAYITPYATH